MNIWLATAHIADSIPLLLHQGPTFIEALYQRIVWEIIGSFLDGQIATMQCNIGITCIGI